MKPSIGRIVLFTSAADPGEPLPDPVPALVTGVHDDGSTIDATTFPRGEAPEWFERIAFSETPAPDTWSWPPRVP